MRRVLAAAALLALLAVAPARADGDPASDILYGDNVFLSLVSPQVNAKGKALETLTAAAAARGLPLKVAVIQTPTDLGAIPQLFGKAAEYVKFLRTEITYGKWQGTLVVVMNGKPGGVAVAGPAARNSSARVARLSIPPGASLDQLGDVAIAAVRAVAASRGVPLPNAQEHSSRNGGRNLLIDALVLVAAVAGAAALIVLTLRRPRKKRGSSGGDDGLTCSRDRNGCPRAFRHRRARRRRSGQRCSPLQQRLHLLFRAVEGQGGFAPSRGRGRVRAQRSDQSRRCRHGR